jgi:hypothetical protein
MPVMSGGFHAEVYDRRMARPTHKAVYEEGPQAAQNFDAAMRKIVRVSPEEIRRRIEAAKKPVSSRAVSNGKD